MYIHVSIIGDLFLMGSYAEKILILWSHLRIQTEPQFKSINNSALSFLLEKEMATLSSTLAWKIPWTEGPGRLQSMGSQRVEHD